MMTAIVTAPLARQKIGIKTEGTQNFQDASFNPSIVWLLWKMRLRKLSFLPGRDFDWVTLGIALKMASFIKH